MEMARQRKIETQDDGTLAFYAAEAVNKWVSIVVLRELVVTKSLQQQKKTMRVVYDLKSSRQRANQVVQRNLEDRITV